MSSNDIKNIYKFLTIFVKDLSFNDFRLAVSVLNKNKKVFIESPTNNIILVAEDNECFIELFNDIGFVCVQYKNSEIYYEFTPRDRKRPIVGTISIADDDNIKSKVSLLKNGDPVLEVVFNDDRYYYVTNYLKNEQACFYPCGIDDSSMQITYAAYNKDKTLATLFSARQKSDGDFYASVTNGEGKDPKIFNRERDIKNDDFLNFFNFISDSYSQYYGFMDLVTDEFKTKNYNILEQLICLCCKDDDSFVTSGFGFCLDTYKVPKTKSIIKKIK